MPGQWGKRLTPPSKIQYSTMRVHFLHTPCGPSKYRSERGAAQRTGTAASGLTVVESVRARLTACGVPAGSGLANSAAWPTLAARAYCWCTHLKKRIKWISLVQPPTHFLGCRLASDRVAAAAGVFLWIAAGIRMRAGTLATMAQAHVEEVLAVTTLHVAGVFLCFGEIQAKGKTCT